MIDTCKRDHEFTPDNTYRAPGSGRRQCVTCKRWRNREHMREVRRLARIYRQEMDLGIR